jgi:hypothetical protein
VKEAIRNDAEFCDRTMKLYVDHFSSFTDAHRNVYRITVEWGCVVVRATVVSEAVAEFGGDLGGERYIKLSQRSLRISIRDRKSFALQ